MDKTKTSGGRPPGRKKTVKIEVVLRPEIKVKFMEIMRIQGKSASVEIGEWINEYISGFDYEKGDLNEQRK